MQSREVDQLLLLADRFCGGTVDGLMVFLFFCNKRLNTKKTKAFRPFRFSGLFCHVRSVDLHFRILMELALNRYFTKDKRYFFTYYSYNSNSYVLHALEPFSCCTKVILEFGPRIMIASSKPTRSVGRHLLVDARTSDKSRTMKDTSKY